MTNPADDVERHVAKYAAVRPRYEQFGQRLSYLLTALVSELGIKTLPIESRAKDIGSFRGKLTRPNKAYADPLAEITDLAGVRIVVYYPEDVDQIAAMIRDELDVDERRSVDKRSAPQPNLFDYESLHLITGLKGARKAMKEWASVNDLLAEIQIRTVLQHAWAVVSHETFYKRPGSEADPFARRLFRLVGMFEVADEQFSIIRAERKKEEEGARAALAAGDKDVQLTEPALREYLHGSSAVRDVWEAAARNMFIYERRDENDDFTAELHALAAKLGLNTVEELNKTVSANVAKADTLFKSLTHGGEHVWRANEAFVVFLMVLLGRNGEVSGDDLVAEGWTPELVDKVMTAIREAK